MELLDERPVASDVMRATMPEPFKRAIVAAAKENLPPVAVRSRFVKQDGEITSGVRYVAAPGHTPSHAAVHFNSGNAQFLFMADVAHNPVTGLQHPEWKPVFDTDPDLAVKTRKAIFDRVATDRVIAMATHFSFPAVGYVIKQEQAFRWEPARWTW